MTYAAQKWPIQKWPILRPSEQQMCIVCVRTTSLNLNANLMLKFLLKVPVATVIQYASTQKLLLTVTFFYNHLILFTDISCVDDVITFHTMLICCDTLSPHVHLS